LPAKRYIAGNISDIKIKIKTLYKIRK